MSIRTSSILSLFLLLLLAGCSVLKPKKTEEAKPAASGPAPVTLVGIVELVNPEQRYVLIRCEQMLGLAPGTELIALDANGAKSRLVLTPERKGYYLTADVKEGSPQVTNLVMLRGGAAAGASPSPSPAPAAPSAPALSSALPVPAPASPPPPGGALPLEPPLPQPTPP